MIQTVFERIKSNQKTDKIALGMTYFEVSGLTIRSAAINGRLET